MWSRFQSFGSLEVSALLILSSLLYVAVISVYRLMLHPLAKYPGPFFSRISGWSIFRHSLTGDRHLEQLLEHERYGPIVRIGPNDISINTASALKQIYGSRRANVQKSQWYNIIDASTGDYSTHSEIDRSKHAARRRVLDHAFSDSALRSAEAFVVENVDTFCKLMASESSATTKSSSVDERAKDSSKPWSESKNMTVWSTYLNYDIMGDLVFGKRFNCMTSNEHHFIPQFLMNGTAFVYALANLPFRAIMRPILASGILAHIGGQMARDERAYVEYATNEMTERIALERKLNSDSATEEKSPLSHTQPRKDIAHYIINAIDPHTNAGFTRTQLDADSSLLIAAGADTTSTTLSAAFFYLLHNPSTLQILTKEIRTAFPTIDSIRATPGSSLMRLPYLRAVIDETLRMAPPVPSILPREVLTGGLAISIPTTTNDDDSSEPDTEEETHIFPAGTDIGVSAYAIHHHPTYFPSPFTFDPSRWLPSPDNTDQLALARSAFCPFSLGTRGCVGRSLAYMELSLSLARILYTFDIRLAADQKQASGPSGSKTHRLRWRKDEFQLYDRFLAERDGPMVEFHTRKT